MKCNIKTVKWKIVGMTKQRSDGQNRQTVGMSRPCTVFCIMQVLMPMSFPVATMWRGIASTTERRGTAYLWSTLCLWTVLCLYHSISYVNMPLLITTTFKKERCDYKDLRMCNKLKYSRTSQLHLLDQLKYSRTSQLRPPMGPVDVQ